MHPTNREKKREESKLLTKRERGAPEAKEGSFTKFYKFLLSLKIGQGVVYYAV